MSEEIARARKELSRLCEARWTGGETWEKVWRWQIPANQVEDTDCIIAAGLDAGEQAESLLSASKSRSEGLEGELAKAWDEGYSRSEFDEAARTEGGKGIGRNPYRLSKSAPQVKGGK